MNRSALRFVRQLRRAIEQRQTSALRVVSAADFVRGGSPSFAQAFDRNGVKLASIERRERERFDDFRERARMVTVTTIPGATRLVLGALPDLAYVADLIPRSGTLPALSVRTQNAAAHVSQIGALRLVQTHRRVAMVCGRRWGKSETLIMIAVSDLLAGKHVALYAPTFKLLSPVFAAVSLALAHLPSVSINRAQGEIRIGGGGELDAWNLDYGGRSGRGRKYDTCLIDEAAHDENRLGDMFQTAILPSLIDRRGRIVLASTPNGTDSENFFWRAVHQAEHQFVVFHAPTRANPHLPAEEIDTLERSLRPQVAAQELRAEFVNLANATIFPLHRLLVDGEPLELAPGVLDYVGAVIDSGAGEKDGPRTLHDGTAFVIYGLELPRDESGEGARVTILDWGVDSLALGAADDWLAMVADTYNRWFQIYRPRLGTQGLMVEKPGMGLRLLELAEAQGLNAREVDTKMMELGKDGRALRVEPHVTRNRVKISRYAAEKQTSYREVTRNHLLSQVTSFVTFDKAASRREDDLLDCFCYAVLEGLGDGLDELWATLEGRWSR